jgi:saccharopine dehydrogenase-like NADP-dependent oxidoreductase
MKKSKIIVLGAGLVGKAMALDLAKNHNVTAVDHHLETLAQIQAAGIRTLCFDLSDRQRLTAELAPFDLVIGAVPGFMGFQTAKAVIAAGKNMVDISFFSEDGLQLDEEAKKAGVTIVLDCGVAPGMGNIIFGYHHQRMKVKSFECLVGGLPVIREWPFEYKAVFSPIDVIEEYLRPARFVQNGKVVVRPALSDPELVYFSDVGTLESWNSDGLRSLIKTMKGVPNMIEKTLRYPGTIEYLKMLRESGFFSYEEVEVKGVKMRPIDITARLLFPKWKLKPGEEEFTVMRVTLQGEEGDISRKHEYYLYDRTDAQGTLSMARTTGYTCTAVANLILDGSFSRKGICPPEYVGEDEGNFRFVLNYLKDRGVKYSVTSSQRFS